MQHENAAAMLVDHAAGALPESLSLVMATYVAMNTEARARYDALTEVGGVLLEDIAPVSATALSANDLLAHLNDDDIDSAEDAKSLDNRFDAHTRALVPSPLRAYLGDSLDNLKWTRRGGGVLEHEFKVGDGSHRVSLLRMAPGKAVPSHTHRGMEYTVVLDGAFEDCEGRMEAGDFACHGAEFTHKPVADAQKGCLCLAVTDAPLKFEGLFGWVVNPFLKH